MIDLIDVLARLKLRKLPGEIKLLVAIVESALIERDSKYFEGEAFKEHSKLLKWDYDLFKKLAVRQIARLNFNDEAN